MHLMNRSYDVAVIGGGLTGLTTSIYLAKAGLSVILLERSEHLGGRAMTVKKQNAYLNLGVHALYHNGEAEQILKELGIAVKGAHPPASAGAIWNQKVYPFPAGPLQLLSSKLFAFSDKMDLTKLMIKLPKIDASQLKRMSLREWAESEIKEPMVRHAVYSVCRSNSFVPHPDHQLAGPAIRQLQRTFAGKAFYVDRGWGSLVSQLSASAQSYGVTIAARKHAAQIVREGSLLRIHLKNDETVVVPSAVVCAGPEDAYNVVGNAEKTSLSRWKKQARPIKAACLDLVLRRLPKPANTFIAGFFLDQPVFYNNPTSVVAMSDDDSVVIHMIKHLGMQPAEPKSDLRQLEEALDMIQPGWQKEELARQFLPNLTVVHDFVSVQRNSDFAGPEVPEIPGLYVAGDWTGRGEMLADVTFASAKRAAQAVIRDLHHARQQGVERYETI